MWRAEENLWCYTSDIIQLVCWHSIWVLGLTGQARLSSQWMAGLSACLCLLSTGITSVHHNAWFCTSILRLDSGPHASKTSTLPAELTPALQIPFEVHTGVRSWFWLFCFALLWQESLYCSPRLALNLLCSVAGLKFIIFLPELPSAGYRCESPSPT